MATVIKELTRDVDYLSRPLYSTLCVALASLAKSCANVNDRGGSGLKQPGTDVGSVAASLASLVTTVFPRLCIFSSGFLSLHFLCSAFAARDVMLKSGSWLGRLPFAQHFSNKVRQGAAK